MSNTKTKVDQDTIVSRFIAVWGVAGDEERHEAVGGIWAADGVEFVEGQRFEGQAEIAARVKHAYEAFIENGRFAARYGDDLTVHGDILRFTVELREHGKDDEGGEHGKGGEPGALAWAARVFLLLDEDGYVQQSYQVTVTPLAPA